MAGAHRIGILTSGGDAPGMNPAIRAIVRTAGAEGITCIGIRRGYAGLINGDVFELTGNDVDGIARRGGTILYTARSEEFRTEAGVDKAAKVCKYLGIDGLITNFHLPESTLIMLISAFYGYDKTMAAYKVAVEEKYRFFSFGDAMFIK